MFRFFLDMGMEDDGFDASTFAKNKERLLKADVARLFFDGVVRRAKEGRLISAEHFTVDGTLIEAWASVKSFKKKGDSNDGPPDNLVRLNEAAARIAAQPDNPHPSPRPSPPRGGEGDRWPAFFQHPARS